MNDNNNETEKNDHSERTSNSDGHIPVNDENTSNNNNDQNSTITTTHIDSLQLPKVYIYLLNKIFYTLQGHTRSLHRSSLFCV